MNDKLEAEFNESEQAEIVETIKKSPVLPESEVATFRTFTGWVEDWFKATEDIADGYRLTIYNYHNDMNIRLNLTELMELISDNIARKIQAIITPADEKYFDMTVPLNKPQCSFFSWYSIEWSRKPKKLIGSLKIDFEQEGIK